MKLLNTFPRLHLLAAGSLTFILGLGFVFTASTPAEARRMSLEMDLETSQVQPRADADKALADESEADPSSIETDLADIAPTGDAGAEDTLTSLAEDPEPVIDWQEFKIRSGDNLAGLFERAGISYGTLLTILRGEGEAKKLEKIYAGETIAFGRIGGELSEIRLTRDRLSSLRITPTENGYKGETVTVEPEIRRAFAAGIIEDSLYLAAKDAGMTDKLTMELAGIYGWDIDFVYDIRKGDRFEVVYEELYVDGEKIDTGRIISASFTNRGEDIVALLYDNEAGESDYYTPEGKSMRKAFLRTPINARVSSPFNLQRRHPVLNVVRPHEGTDYAAPTGTPIKSAGAGRVRFAGWKGGYGRTVIVGHGDNISTLYAHMSRLGPGIRNGVKVKQGQTIGYVGKTGMVTGAHLHYEFRVNGSPRNSRTVSLPDAKPVPNQEMDRFKSAVDIALNEMKTERDRANHMTLARGE